MPDGLAHFDIPKPSYNDLIARIAALEDVLEELAPFSECVQFDAVVNFSASTKEEAEAKGQAFKRDTLFIDQRVFRKVAKLLRQRVT